MRIASDRDSDERFVPTGSEDLLAAACFTVLAVAVVVLPVVRATPVRPVLAVPFALVVPGYAFLAAAFPSADRLSFTARSVFSICASLPILTLVGMSLHFSPWGLTPLSELSAVAGVVLICLSVAARRRARLPPEARFSLADRELSPSSMFAAESRAESLVNGVVLVSVVVALASVGTVIATDPPTETYTEFSVLGENESGLPSGSAYPHSLSPGEPAPLYLTVHNDEGRSIDYTIVALIQRVNRTGESLAVAEERRIETVELSVGHGDERRVRTTVSTEMKGQPLHLRLLLYHGQPPTDPSVSNAYRDLHLWIDITSPDTPERGP